MPTAKHGYPRPLVLKDGEEVWLRLLDSERDEKELLDFYRRLPEDERWYLWHDVSDPQVVRECILHYDPRLVLPIVAVNAHERIVAKATMYRHFPGARGHIGRLRLILDPAYRRRRLGTYLLLDLVHLGLDLGLSLLVAELIRGVEDQAIRAAEKLDFFPQAVLPDYIRDRRGNRYDLVFMVKRIHRGYDDF
jgi:GNAT superfamily N-acetyltransferase